MAWKYRTRTSSIRNTVPNVYNTPPAKVHRRRADGTIARIGLRASSGIQPSRT